jgi:pantoate kinase
MVLIRVPLSVSLLWYPVKSSTVEQSGSIGISMTLEPSLIAESKRGEGTLLNGIPLKEMPNIKFLQEKLGKVKIEAYSRVPLGYGYGLSGALSVAYAIAASELLGIDEERALVAAHESEIISGNGFGDVISQISGGIVCRKKPGAPGYGEVVRLHDYSSVIYSKILEKLPTSTIISGLDWVKDVVVNSCNLPLQDLFSIARKFTEDLGFISPYPLSYRKKGIIVKIGDPKEGVWTLHTISKFGASVI